MSCTIWPKDSVSPPGLKPDLAFFLWVVLQTGIRTNELEPDLQARLEFSALSFFNLLEEKELGLAHVALESQILPLISQLNDPKQRAEVLFRAFNSVFAASLNKGLESVPEISSHIQTLQSFLKATQQLQDDEVWQRNCSSTYSEMLNWLLKEIKFRNELAEGQLNKIGNRKGPKDDLGLKVFLDTHVRLIHYFPVDSQVPFDQSVRKKLDMDRLFVPDSFLSFGFSKMVVVLAKFAGYMITERKFRDYAKESSSSSDLAARPPLPKGEPES